MKLRLHIMMTMLVCIAAVFCVSNASAGEVVKVYKKIPPAAAAGEAENESPSLCEVDADCDGVPDEEETRFGTDPNLCDTDEDGLSDGTELGKIQPDDTNGCHALQAVGSNYKKPHVMDPLNPDSDGDGLSDGAEDANANGWVDFEETDPTLEDTDMDDLSDYTEMLGDFDGDGLADFDFRLIKAGQKCTPPENIADLDCDEIPNARDGDSDNDGCPDNTEGEFTDANANGIPDRYDNQSKSACPQADTGGSASGGKKAAGGEPETPNLGPYPGDGTDEAACTLIPSANSGPSNSAAPISLMFFITIFLFAFSRLTHSRT